MTLAYAVHIIPTRDSRPHDQVSTCWCKPRIDIVEGTPLVVHNSTDGREAVEWTNKILDK